MQIFYVVSVIMALDKSKDSVKKKGGADVHLRDISLKKRLLITNALMVIIPIVLMLAAGTVLLGGLRHAGTLQQQALTLLWPEKGTSLSVQFALSSLHAEAAKKRLNSIILRVICISSRARASASRSSSRANGSICHRIQIPAICSARLSKNTAGGARRSYGTKTVFSSAGRIRAAACSSSARATYR
ncbi:hypothetical protein HMPREF9162_2321 [Selenomonas sp. oral taxon 137 str. F0430]|nr:hypothetical protein HMPREF9162_2321 [Selenomonas sp. oral taxon 137 str. F0430]